MLKKLPTMYTTDNTSEKLRWLIEGYIPKPGKDEKIAALERKIATQDKKNIDQEKELKELR